MGEYTFTDLRVGDSVFIRGGKMMGHVGIIEHITTRGFLLRLDTGELRSIRFASMLEKLC